MVAENQTQDRYQSSAELLWANPRHGARGPKPRLTVEQIVRSAISIADTEGISALSMQRLATELDSGTMSLYRYIPGKDELVSLALDTVIGPPPQRRKNEDWRTGLEHWARRNLAVFEEHPWALPLATTPRVMGRNETAHVEAALQVLADTPLSPAAKMHTVLLVNAYVRGAARGTADSDPTAHDAPPMAHEMVERYGEQDTYPLLTATVQSIKSTRQRLRATDEPFDYGLHRILDGIEKLISSMQT